MSWDELVAAALVGTERRPVEPDAPPGAPAALGAALRERGEDGLLAAAAAWTVARRAGALPGPRREVAPAPADARPPCSPQAAARLERLLEEGEDRLVDEWLELAGGLRPPPELVPALLDHGLGDPRRQLRAVEAAGPLGPWLAARNARWSFVPGAADLAAVWADGEPAARRLVLTRLRLTDPAAARELLAGTLASEAAEDRVTFVRALATGLSDADEPLLERVLDDRRQDVRAAAAELLARLPRSRFAARMAARAAALLALEPAGDGRRRLVPRRGAAERLVVTLPGEPDAAARRDGIPRRGRRSDALALILAHAPLATWTERFGRPPAQIAELPVADDFAALVHGALATAALDQRDAGWARVLWPRRLELLALLPDDEAPPRSPLPAPAPAGKVTWPSSDALAAAVPGPWGPELSRRVVATIRTELEWAVKPVSELAYALDPSVLGELEPLIEAGGARIVRLCDVLATRAAMLRELS